MITDKQRTYFDAMEKMMATDGWPIFLDDLRGNQEAIKESIMSQADMEKFFIAKGRYLTLSDILGLQNFLEGTRKALEEDEEAEENAII